MRREIPEALADLEARGEISAEQRQRIQAALAARLDAPRDHSGRVIAVVASFGALLFSAGILYLVAIHWDALGKSAKLALVFGVWAAIHAGGYALAEQPGGYPRIGRALTLAGMLCFGGALYLVAQIYNLSAHYPWALLLWWVLDVPLWLWMRSRAAQALVTGLFLVWIFWHTSVWFEGQAGWFHSDRFEVYCNLFLGGALAALFSALAALVGSLRAERYTGLWRALGLCGALFLGYLVSFHWDFGHPRAFREQLGVLTPALLVLAAALLVLLAAHALGQRGTPRAEALAVLVFAALLAAVFLWAEEALPWIGNLLVLGALLALVWHGTRTRSAALVNLALGFFALLILTRYVEYLWDKLAGAYAFLSAGALLLGLGWFLEHRRRSLMLRMRGGAA